MATGFVLMVMINGKNSVTVIFWDKDLIGLVEDGSELIIVIKPEKSLFIIFDT